MKKLLIKLLNKYLEIFPEEHERQNKLINFLNIYNDDEITDWNNFSGHIVAGGFIYAKKENRFLVLYHKDLNMYLYPGGHIDSNDKNPFVAAKREIREECGLNNLKKLKICDEELIPIDIDTHMISYNERLNLPGHYHFEFRYLFMIDRIQDINVELEELGNYQWIDLTDLRNDPNYGAIANKIEILIKKG